MLAAILVVLTLSACGFDPVYATKIGGKSVALSRPDIEIANIPDRDGQYLRNILIDQLNSNGRPADAHYQLNFTPLAKNIVNLGIRKDATATRAQMQIATRMQLVEKSTGRVLLQRDLKTVGAYNLLDNQFATLISQKGMTDNILEELGSDVVTELNLYFRRKAQS